MEFVLFMMFFITPPNKIDLADKGTTKDTRVWTLQSTVTMDFNTPEQCKAVKENIAARIEKTNTLQLRSWCVGKGVHRGASGNAASEGPGGPPPAGLDLNLIEPLR